MISMVIVAMITMITEAMVTMVTMQKLCLYVTIYILWYLPTVATTSVTALVSDS